MYIIYNIDFTYLFEKIKIYSKNKIFFEYIIKFKIQENILFKYLTFISNSNIYSTHNNCKFHPLIGLNKYILHTFPIITPNIKLNNSTHKLEIQIQKNFSKKNNIDKLNIRPKFLNINIKSIEQIFEIYSTTINTYLINYSMGVLINLYKINKYTCNLEIIVQNLLFNLSINIISTNEENVLNCFKMPNSLVLGGEVISPGDFSPQYVVDYYSNTLFHFTSIYESSKNTFIYIYNIILESVVKQYIYQGVMLPSFLFEIIVKRMVSYVKINFVGDTSLSLNDTLDITFVNLINKSFSIHGLMGAVYYPIVLGISKISIAHSGLLSSLSFQDTLKSLSNLVVGNKTDWLIDLKSKIIISDLLSSGTGWYKHYSV